MVTGPPAAAPTPANSSQAVTDSAEAPAASAPAASVDFALAPPPTHAHAHHAAALASNRSSRYRTPPAALADPLHELRGDFDASRCHDAAELAMLKRAAALFHVLIKERARHKVMEDRKARAAAAAAATDVAAAGGDGAAPPSPLLAPPASPGGEDAMAFAAGVMRATRIRLEQMTDASDSMPPGALHVLWGWKVNVAGDEMARLLYSPNGYNNDGSSNYDAALARYRRRMHARREWRAAIVVQRGTRRMAEAKRKNARTTEGARKMAAMRCLTRLQARWRAIRARHAPPFSTLLRPSLTFSALL